MPAVPVLFNRGAGTSADSARQAIEQTLESLDCEGRLVEPGPGESLQEVAASLAEQAGRLGTIMIAAGGDGTVSAVASQCFLHGVPLAVVPLGTFNYFAREFGLPTDPAEAVRVAIEGVPTLVDVCFVNGRMFINNASFGIYPRLIRERESSTDRLGRKRWVAACSLIGTLLREHPRFAVSIDADGVRSQYRTTLVFVGNNAWQLEQLGLEVADCIVQGQLAVIIAPPVSRGRRLWQVLLAVAGHLHREDALERFCVKEIVVDSKRRTIELALDGELCSLTPPLAFNKCRKALTLMLPATGRTG